MPSHELVSRLRDELRRVILGKPEAIDNVIVAVLSGSHILMEDVPGVGKTTLAKALAKSIAGSFKRVQFTPDLLPTDILGSSIYREMEASRSNRVPSSRTCSWPTRSTARRPAPSRASSRP